MLKIFFAPPPSLVKNILWPLKISSGPLLGINNDWSLISSNKIKFYSRYVDDILVLIRPSDIPTVLQKFNYFHPQIQFTHEEFTDNNDIHFLEI